MTDREWINGSEAFKEAVKRGYSKSYPTFLKWMRDSGLGIQPTGKGAMMVDKRRFLDTFPVKRKRKEA